MRSFQWSKVECQGQGKQRSFNSVIHILSILCFFVLCAGFLCFILYFHVAWMWLSLLYKGDLCNLLYVSVWGSYKILNHQPDKLLNLQTKRHRIEGIKKKKNNLNKIMIAGEILLPHMSLSGSPGLDFARTHLTNGSFFPIYLWKWKLAL